VRRQRRVPPAQRPGPRSRSRRTERGSYRGPTSESQPIGFAISGRKIQQLHTTIGYNGKCGQGGGPGYSISAGGVKINAKGKFSATVTLLPPVKSIPNAKGSLTGTASGSTVHGKIVDLKTAHFKCNGYTETFAATGTH
jgi:hypothetical protein